MVLDNVVLGEVIGFKVETGDVKLVGVSELPIFVLVVDPSFLLVLDDIVFGVVSGITVDALIWFNSI